MHKYGHVVFRQHEVRFSGQVSLVKPEAEAERMKSPPHQQLRFGVLGPNAGHHAAPDLGRDYVSHVRIARPSGLRQDALRKRRICFGMEATGAFNAPTICFASAATSGTTTELPNCLYAWVSETDILKDSGNPIKRAHSRGVSLRGFARCWGTRISDPSL